MLCCWQLSEAALLQLAEMGYSQVESSRALRFSGGDLAAAVNFLTEQQLKQKVPVPCLCGVSIVGRLPLYQCVLWCWAVAPLDCMTSAQTPECVCCFISLESW